KAGTRGPLGAVEDPRQPTPMLAFAVEGAAYGSKGCGERKNVGSDEQVDVFGTHRVPIDAVRGYRDFRHQISARQCDALRGKAAQCNAADHPVLLRALPGTEEMTEVLGLGLSR